MSILLTRSQACAKQSPALENSDLMYFISSHERASYHSAHPFARAVKIGSPRLEVQAGGGCSLLTGCAAVKTIYSLME